MGVRWPPAGREGIDLCGDGEQFWGVVGRREGKMLSRGTGRDAGDG